MNLRLITLCTALYTLLLSGCQGWPPGTQEAPQDQAFAQLDADIAAYRLTTPRGQNALEKLQQLELQYPGEPRLLEYRQAIARAYLRLSKQRLERGDTEGARHFLSQGLALAPELAELKALKAELEPTRKPPTPQPAVPLPLPPQAPARQLTLDQRALEERDESLRLEVQRFIAGLPPHLARIEIKAPDFYQRRWLEILVQNALEQHPASPQLRSEEDARPRLEVFIQSSAVQRYQF